MQKNTRRPRVLLADDFPQILEEVQKLLGNDFEIVGFAHDGGQALRLALTLNPDVLLLDISMPVLCGLEVARRLREAKCNAKIVFITVHEDHDYLDSAISVGASAYVLKGRIGTDLLPAIYAALEEPAPEQAVKLIYV
jgi:DNA-binding NarL/FixJ family response regulator